METILFEKREVLGKKNAQLVRKGITPTVIYNEKGESFATQVETGFLKRLLRASTSTTILDAKLDGKDMKVVVKDIDFNPINDVIRHVAFYQIDETKPMIFTVPFNIVGISPAVKNNLGVLVKALNAVDVKCNYKDLKPYIEIDISNLEHVGQSVTVADLTLPEGMTLPNDSQKMNAIVTITQLQKAEVVETAAATTEEGAETPATTETTEEAKEE